MCVHISLTEKLPVIEDHYQVTRNPQLEIEDADLFNYHLNGYSHPEAFIIPEQESTVINPAIWGIMPHDQLGSKQNDYYKKVNRKGGGLNARSEKLFDHFIYKYSAFEKRCVVPITAFFEPHEYRGTKYPILFKNSKEKFLSVAGIYSITKDGFVSFSLLTKKGSPFFAKIHNTTAEPRQIILLNDILVKEWLNPDLTESHIKEIMNVQFPESELQTYSVSRDVFKQTDSNYPEILEFEEYEGLDI